MILDYNNLCAKTELLPISRAVQVMKSSENVAKTEPGAFFLATDRLTQRTKYWECVKRDKTLLFALYLRALAESPYPRPPEEFSEKFGGVPSFVWTEVIDEALNMNHIRSIIKWHAETVAPILGHLICALPADAQFDAVMMCARHIDPQGDYFYMLWHTVSVWARVALAETFPECAPAKDILPQLAAVPIDSLNDEILRQGDRIRAEDCDDVIELALLRFAAESKKRHGEGYDEKKHKHLTMPSLILEFAKRQGRVIGGASDECLESLLCLFSAITHEKSAPGAKDYFAEKFAPKNDDLVLPDAPAKMGAVVRAINNDNFNGVRMVFDSVSRNSPRNASAAQLLLLFRMAVMETGLFQDLTPSMIPEIMSREKDIPEDFLWRFRCDYGLSVLGLAPPEIKGAKDFGLVEKEPDVVDISDKSPAAVFAALYNYAWPSGMGFAQYLGIPMREDEAESILKKSDGHFGYFIGRAMGLNIKSNTKLLNVSVYNSDNGRGIAQRAIRTVPNGR